MAPLLCFGVAWLVSQTAHIAPLGWSWLESIVSRVERMEWRTLDWRTQFRVHFQPQPMREVAIVLYGDDTEANVSPWPADRAVHAEFIQLLTLAEPRTIAWDVILDSMREGEGDEQMALAVRQAMSAGTAVITATVTDATPSETQEGFAPGPSRPLTQVEGDIRRLIGDKYPILPFPKLRAESFYGFADTPADEDGLRRLVPLVVRVGSDVFPSLALQTLMAYFGSAPADVRVKLGDAVYLTTKERGMLRLPIALDGRFLVNYRYDRDETGEDFQTFEYIEAMVKLHARYVEKNDIARDVTRLKGAIVLIGQNVTGRADAGPTPLSGYSPLVLMHANLIHNVLAHDYASRAPSWAVWLGALVVGYAGVLIGLRRTVWVMATFAVLTIVVYVTATFAVWIKWSVWLPFVAPLAAFSVLQFVVIGRRVLKEQHARDQVKQMFGNYLSPELLKKMMKGGKNVANVSSERRPVTILFSDLRDFTSLTERLSDQALIEQLNEYLAAMVECIHREGGTLHKFIGDAVMAVWGDLESKGTAEDARRAARAALAMGATLAQLNTKWVADGKPALRMGIGLNHGVVLVGNIGSPRRMEFTAIGDAVNLASRLESLTKELKVQVLIGESVEALLAGAFELRACGEVPVKGKAKPVTVFELRGAAGVSAPASVVLPS